MDKSFAAKIAPAFRGITGAATVKFTEGAADGKKIEGATIEEVYENLMFAANETKIYVDGVGSFEAVKTGKTGRCANKISIVTGSAQGFGFGIASAMVEEGAYMVYCDLNIELAQQRADEANAKYGAGTAVAIKVDVSNEESVANLIDETVLAFGGLDVFVNNAGVVRSGPVEELSLKDFTFVTNIDYIAYFTCVKYCVAPMKIEKKFAPDKMFDIIQINSKSGLEGSNKNSAYAGAKFGGIGLTQSFALELAPFGIKVNSICPGNFLNGPLWSDPEKGLFVQYFKAGKVPGAKSVEDVRAFYESKVPLGRGCETTDVNRAIYYLLEQEYETGQALPVTGGQVMLN